MIRKLLLFCSMIVLLSMYSLAAVAGGTTSNIGVKMRITHANCIVNGGTGFSGTYNLPLMNDQGRSLTASVTRMYH